MISDMTNLRDVLVVPHEQLRQAASDDVEAQDGRSEDEQEESSVISLPDRGSNPEGRRADSESRPKDLLPSEQVFQGCARTALRPTKGSGGRSARCSCR